MAGNEISLIDKVGRPDRSLAESQVRNRYAARLLGVVSKVCLSIKVGMVTDDLNGVFVSAYSTVCAQTPELAGCCSGRSGIKLANIIPIEDAVKYMKDAATTSYSKKGDAIVKMNHDAIDAGYQQVVEVKVPEAWKNAKDTAMGMPKAKCADKTLEKFVNEIQIPCNEQKGDELPVSTFVDMADGTFPQGSAAFEKRGIAVDVPKWIPENCIQCNFCSYVCPHAVIRPCVMTEEELKKAPKLAQEKAVPMTGMPGYYFMVTMSALDCTGCGDRKSVV